MVSNKEFMDQLCNCQLHIHDFIIIVSCLDSWLLKYMFGYLNNVIWLVS